MSSKENKWHFALFQNVKTNVINKIRGIHVFSMFSYILQHYIVLFLCLGGFYSYFFFPPTANQSDQVTDDCEVTGGAEGEKTDEK